MPRGPPREAPGPPGSRRNKGKMWARVFIVFSIGRDKPSGLGLASLNNFGRLWGKGTVPGCGTWPWGD